MPRQNETSGQMQAVQKLLQKPAAYLLGITPRCLRDSDAPRLNDGRYDGQALVSWWAQRHVRPEAEDDPLLLGSDSPNLERYRSAKADLLEMERDAKRGLLVPREEVVGIWTTVGGWIRKGIERLGVRFGAEAQEIMLDSLNSAKRAFGDRMGDDGSGGK